MFVAEELSGAGDAGREPIATMPGVQRLSLQEAVAEAAVAAELGLAAVMLFGIPAEKDEQGSGAWDEEGVVQLATRAIKQARPELLVITDVCLCEYTDHGHCGVLRGDGAVDNDATVSLLARTAVSHARAGADMVAPSDMMDGRVGAIRDELDGEGFADTPILAYSAKFASAFYGPFRDAAGSTPSFGDRRAYQMDPANGREAEREALLDLQEGADMVMVKPALAYGDLISAVKRATLLPWRPTTSAASMRWSRQRQRRLPGRARSGARDPHLPAPRRRRHDRLLPRKGRRPMASRAELSKQSADAERASAAVPRSAAAATAPPCP